MIIFFGNNQTIPDSYPEVELSEDPGNANGLFVSRPGHCGEDMQLTLHCAAAVGNSPLPGLDDPRPDLHLIWQCKCGFLL